MGDANLCSAKWKDPKFLHRKIANQLIGCLEHCDLTQGDVGVTFESDHVQASGPTSESELDHVYLSNKISKEEIEISTIKNSSSDHHPVLVMYKKAKANKIYTRKIVKRSFKNFNPQTWNETLQKRNWSEIEDTEDLDKKVDKFTRLVAESLDKLAPMTNFTVKSKHLLYKSNRDGYM